MKHIALLLIAFLFVVSSSTLVVAQDAAPGNVLPAPEPPFQGKIGRTVKDSKTDFPKEVQPPSVRPTSCSS